MDYKDFLRIVINRKAPNPIFKKAIEDAEYNKKLFTGLNQETILENYRTQEDADQKKQRSRITISRTKHVCRQIDNILSQLQMMDTPLMNVLTDSEKETEDLLNYIYEYDLSNLAFNRVKHFGSLVDANAFLKCGINEYGEIDFDVVEINNLYDIYIVNDKLKAVVFKFESGYGLDKKEVFELYYEGGYYIFSENPNDENGDQETWSKYFITHERTDLIFAFPLGYINDENNNKSFTKITILEAASELFKSLIWQGSELDVVIATQGINKQFAFAPPCNYRYSYTNTEGDLIEQYCVGGYIQEGGHSVSKCPVCDGTGLQIHTSNQDIILFPFPKDGNAQNLKLSDLTHTVYVNPEAFNFLKQDIKDIKAEIISTVFNQSIANKPQVSSEETATKSIIDLQGVYAILNTLGKQVSNCFIWMVNCVASIKGYGGPDKIRVLHGYTLTLKLETIEDLSIRRQKLTEAGAPIEIIRSIDLAMMQKRHLDDPGSVSRYAIWEQYRPFSDKSESTITSFISSLPEDNKYRIWFYFWGVIKKNIEIENGDKFYDMSHEARLKLIEIEIDKIRENFTTQELLSGTLDIIEE